MTWNNKVNIEQLTVGAELPVVEVPITTTLITSGAIATRDYFPGHHDKDAAQALGSPHVFMNILTTSALVQRYVEDWAGAATRFEDIKVKLGAPNYPGDTMTFKGVIEAIDIAAKRIEVTVKGNNGLGNHVTSNVTFSLATTGL
ncbi:MaoC/PaaZ C-terminal domain-containing protein [Thalassotalea ponticola]|uniref:MaoC/PaaZ C-terminal domain-containing protein n=1 Tax=Thalassotalea ponticola TaxID=1523392 RepID=UPI0025B4DB12|nr:MaoC/PaaZ C-terminal domain-containing protein [Thalassotalea ponticola]MDN3653451.1 MaoC/PaaZ C-terminal domain-containing protein [Thalassotalea ponticola]